MCARFAAPECRCKRCLQATSNSAEPTAPIAGPLLAVHHRDNQHPVGLVNVQDSVRESTLEVPSHWRIEHSVPFWAATNFAQQFVDLLNKTAAKRCADGRILQGRVSQLPVRIRVKAYRLHLPTILRTLAIT